MPANETTDSPIYHGFAPPGARRANLFTPPFSIAISRATGSRGQAIAKRVAETLGWQFVNQETLEYLTQNASYSPGSDLNLAPTAQAWVNQRLRELSDAGTPATNPELVGLVRLILEVSASQPCVILGRGAGCVLPTTDTLHVRILAPLDERVAYISQLERLSHVEAERFIEEREKSRQQFISQFGRSPDDVLQYDLVLNAGAFGVESSATIIAAAAKEKDRRRQLAHT